MKRFRTNIPGVLTAGILYGLVMISESHNTLLMLYSMANFIALSVLQVYLDANQLNLKMEINSLKFQNLYLKETMNQGMQKAKFDHDLN